VAADQARFSHLCAAPVDRYRPRGRSPGVADQHGGGPFPGPEAQRDNARVLVFSPFAGQPLPAGEALRLSLAGARWPRSGAAQADAGNPGLRPNIIQPVCWSFDPAALWLQRNAELPRSAILLVVDETSMGDVPFDGLYLLDALPSQRRLLLV